MGVNLAKDFENPATADTFATIQKAVAAKQEYETREIKNLVHGPEGGTDMEVTIAITEKTRERFVKALRDVCNPVDHEILIVPAEEAGR